MKNCAHYNSGFTLVELMVVIGILGILGFFLINANVSTLFSRSSISSTAMSLHAALNFARNESMSRGTPVTFCRPNAAADDCAANDALPLWQDGWMVVATNNDGSSDVRVFPSDFGSNGSNTLGKTGLNQIVFTNGSADQNATFVLCDKDQLINANAREVVITMSGRIRTVAGNDPTAPLANCLASN